MYINIFGTDTTARNFILQTKDINVKCFIESGTYKNRKFMEGYSIVDIPLLTLDQACNDYLYNYYTVVCCSPHLYKEIKRLLEGLELVEFHQFEYYKTFRKKVAILYGNCHMMSLSSMLETSSDFNKEYGIYPMDQIQELASGGGISNVDYNKAFHRCCLFIQQYIKSDNYFGKQYASENYLRLLPSGCCVITLPNLFGLPQALFPQLTSFTKGERWDGPKYFFFDCYIAESYNHLSVNEIVELMEDETLINKNEILDRYDGFLMRLYEKEKNCDVGIASFIEDNITKYKLFYETWHPTGCVVRHFAQECLKIIFGDRARLFFSEGIELDKYEVFTYACVRKALNFQYHENEIRKFNGLKIRDVFMDREEYVKQYLMWNHKDFYKERENK